MAPLEVTGGREGSPLRAGLDLAARLALERHCVLRDAYDTAAFRGLLEASPRLRECSRRGEARLLAFPILLSDVFCLLFKMRPQLIDRGLVRPAFQVNRYLIARLAAEAHVKRLRATTILDEEASAEATAAVGARLLGELAAHDLERENLLFELEESIDEGGRDRHTPAPVRRKSADGHLARAAGQSDGSGSRPLAYDLQRCLEMAEALESFQSFERLLALAKELVQRMTSDDPTALPPTEVFDVGVGDELSRVLPGELVSLRAPARRKDFLRRLLGSRLLSYRIAGRQWSGALVIVVDVSHSMAGEKEIASKALAIALCERAAVRGQPAHAILFGHRSAPLWHLDFGGRRPQRHQIVALAETFYGGGTDFERPLSQALDLIAARGEEGGQIVFVSDGQCDVSERWLGRFLAMKARRQLRILGVVIDSGVWSEKTLASFSDRVLRWSQVIAERD